MTAGSGGSLLDGEPGTPPGLDVVDAALRHMFNDVDGGMGAAAEADSAAIDALVNDALHARRDGRTDTVVSTVGAIVDRHGRVGVNRAIAVLGEMAEATLRQRGQTGTEVDINATIDPDLPTDQRAILLASARLASELLSARLAHDGARLAETVNAMPDETLDPVLSMLVGHVAAAHGSAPRG